MFEVEEREGLREKAGKTLQLRSFSPTAGALASPLPAEEQVPSCQGPLEAMETREILFLFIVLTGKWGGVKASLRIQRGRWAGRLELSVWRSRSGLEKEVGGGLYPRPPRASSRSPPTLPPVLRPLTGARRAQGLLPGALGGDSWSAFPVCSGGSFVAFAGEVFVALAVFLWFSTSLDFLVSLDFKLGNTSL